jgi:xanthine dehydrogenase molybdenum-binding subunit
MVDYKPNMVLSNQEYKVVGTRPIRHDGLDKVTGRARYGADFKISGLLYGKVLRSPHAHARINSIDISKALRFPGVKAVVTASDLPQPSDKVIDQGEGATANIRFQSNNCLAYDKVLYKGHAVAAVAASNLHIAEHALSLIDVDYEIFPSVLTAAEAMKENATLLHERLLTSTVLMGPLGTGDENTRGTNIAKHMIVEIGDLKKGFQEADVIIEREFSTQAIHQGYIEPHAVTALWDEGGNVTLWFSSQGQFQIRDQTAQILGIPISRVKAIPLEIGGGFGGKTQAYLEPTAALLSRKTGQPVKLTMNRDEVFNGTGPTPATHSRVKIGATKDGRITAAEAYVVYEAGAYPGGAVGLGGRVVFSAYDIPNAYIELLDVMVNKPKSAAYRAPGAPAAAFAAEQVIDEICQEIGMDPLEFRLINSAQEGTRQVTGPIVGAIGYRDVLQATKDHQHYVSPLEGPNRGRGVAVGAWHTGAGVASAIASVNADGSVSLVEGSPDIGGSRAAMAMQLAETLGIAAEEVKPSVGDTDSVGFTSMTVGSGATFKSGWACYEAGQDIIRQLAQRAAKIWEVPAEDVEYQDATLLHKSDPELKMTFKQLAGRLNATGGPIVGSATVNPRSVGDNLATHIVDVEVDPETGKVDILRYTALQDVGKAIHPAYVEGQIQGGAVQGIGWALNEEYFYNADGQMMNATFLDYRMPTSLDLPMIDTVLIETHNPGHPYGLRGVGESPIIPPMAAIANAISRAVGVRMTQLPMSPGRILNALKNEHKVS